MVLTLIFLLSHLRLPRVLGDCYMHNPRGSNNKLTEQNNNAQNQNRLFDSQNNAAGGYQVGDNCVPNCKNNNQYDHDKDGSQLGTMYYYHGSELYVEWTSQHSCGSPDPGVPGKNTHCQVVLQYMCDSDAPGLRDGKDPDGNRRRSGGGNNNNPAGANKEAADELTRGRHETFEYYDACRKRQRNKGLYNADKNLIDRNGATATRQNEKGNRRGLECPEERDYYPYWHPTPWRDVAVFTDTPVQHCGMYRRESQNVVGRGYCKITIEGDDATLDPEKQVPNNEKACNAAQGEWKLERAWDTDPPECLAMPYNRDNHLGNIETGKPMSYVWTIPDTIPHDSICVLRIRYNITSGDFNKAVRTEDESEWDPFFDLDSRFNGQDAPLKTDPKDDFVGLGWGKSGPLQMQVDTAQFGRTFQDRSHVFRVKQRPSSVSSWSRIVNYNVRGRRGNIVQVYPAVEYDFVPQDLVVQKGDYLHFQWTGSDANANGNAGNGRQGTDRSNLVQLASRQTNKPLLAEEHTLLFDAPSVGLDSDAGKEGKRLVERFAFLDQQEHAKKAQSKECPADKEEATNKDDNDDDNCLQLNAAPAYFDGGLVEMRVGGAHHIASTRNNDFTNRAQKATIFVHGTRWIWWEVLLLVLGILVAIWLVYHILFAVIVLNGPVTSRAFARRNRPLFLRLPCCRRCVTEKEKARAKYKEDIRACTGDGAKVKASLMGNAKAWTEPPRSDEDIVHLTPGSSKTKCPPCFERCCKNLCLLPYAMFNGLDWRMPAPALFLCFQLVVALAGFGLNLNGGFNLWYPVAKSGGYMLDLNLSVLLLPTMRSVQTYARQVRALDLLFNSDPIQFHIRVAGFVCIGTVLHVVGHVCHVAAISSNGRFVNPVTKKQAMSGRSVLEIFFDPSTRFAPITGIIILFLMMAMGLTASARIRRKTFDFGKFPRTCTGIIAWSMLLLVGLLLLPMLVLRLLCRCLWMLFSCSCRCSSLREEFSCGDLRGKVGGFRIFWSVHKNWIPVYILLLVHGPQCWIWFLWPLIILICDRLVSRDRRQTQVVLKTATLLKGNVLNLTFSLPKGFVYQAGHYVQLCCEQVNPEEWHPFTLTSAPEEEHLSVHIRCPPELDWCSALRKRLAEIPAKDVSQGEMAKDCGYRVHYAPHMCQNHAINGPDAEVERRFDAAQAAAPRVFKARDVEEAEDHERQPTVASLEDLLSRTLPSDAVRIRMDGPHGAPSELVWKHKVCVLVGTGIGVTPFASILRSLNLSARGKGGPRRRSEGRGGQEPGIEVNWTPCQSVYFYWLCRGQDEFEWFYDLLQEAVQGPNKERVEVHLFQTGVVELAKVKPLDCGFKQFLGKPNWAKCFGQISKDHSGEDIGVFLCGPPAIRRDLVQAAASVHAQKINDAHFEVYAENF